MNAGVPINPADQILEGSPLDRFVLSGLVAFSVIMLVSQGQKVATLLRANRPIVLFLLYCGLSVLWSDYPMVAFKRWIKAVGDLAIVLVVLTDRDPSAAVKRLLTRTAFLLVPVSVFLIKYYPDVARGWSRWGGDTQYAGVATDKNGLGTLCLLVGIGFVWLFFRAFRGAEGTRRTGPLLAQGTLLTMVLWLFWMARSMTSLSCFIMAAGLMVMTSLPRFARRSAPVHLFISAMVAISFSILFLNVGSDTLEIMGRDPTLTGRTAIWTIVLGLTENSLFGTGFESFWIGQRIRVVWSFFGGINEAHNGYLEVFLSLGWIGVVLLAVVMVTGYRNVVSDFRRDPDTGKLRLAYVVAFVVYNFTESAVRVMHPVWICYLLAIIAVPGGWVRPVDSFPKSETSVLSHT